MKFVYYILSVLLGFVFLFSAYSKLYPIELFELTFTDLGISGWSTAPFLARIVIGLEFFLGILLILNFQLHKFTLKAVIGLLAVFTLYLGALWAMEGNSGNCKCFGNMLPMSPAESVLKNVVLLIVAIVIYWFHPANIWRYIKWIYFTAAIIAILIPFSLNPVDLMVSNQLKPEYVNYHIDLNVLYGNPKIIAPKEDLRKGKHIIAFMSLSCPHCRVAGYKLYVMKKRNPALPLYLVLNGDDDKLKTFFDDTKATNIPFTMVLGKPFIKMAGVNLPVILWVDNGLVVRKTKYLILSQSEIENWLKEQSVK